MREYGHTHVGKTGETGTDIRGQFRATRALRLVSFLTLALVAGVVWGIKQLGDMTRRDIATRDRYTVRFADIECAAPPGLQRINFLAEVRYQSRFPQSFQSIDPGAEGKLTTAFGMHPWVAEVEGVSLDPANRVRVDLKFRTPALAITVAGAKDVLRVVDTHGILLPVGVASSGLPVIVTPVSAPATPSGQRWDDGDVQRAVELIQSHQPRQMEKTEQGWRLTMGDGKILTIDK